MFYFKKNKYFKYRKPFLLQILVFQILTFNAIASEKVAPVSFVYKTTNYGETTNTTLQLIAHSNALRYEASLNLPVCDDHLCANVVLKMFWDLAGNYAGFDTLTGKPLTKFDHHPFTPADYQKLDEILSDKNSILRVLEKEELTDKNVKLKSSTVDAVTGATPASVKDQVVEGAVYSAFTLWNFVNGAIKDSIRHYTKGILSDQLAEKMLLSTNYETQIFALSNLENSFYETHTTLIFEVLTKSSPLVRAYILNKTPIPFSTMEKNKTLASLYANLDSYSKSVFRKRLSNNKLIESTFLPLLNK